MLSSCRSWRRGTLSSGRQRYCSSSFAAWVADAVARAAASASRLTTPSTRE